MEGTLSVSVAAPLRPAALDDSHGLLPEDVASITLAVQHRIGRIVAAGSAQSSQVRLELTELESRCRRLEIERDAARKDLDGARDAYRIYRNRSARVRQLLAEQLDGTSQVNPLADPLVICDEGPSFAELTDLATERGGPG